MIRTPRQLVEHNYVNLVQYTDLPEGGHFTAFELPELVSSDIRSFVSKVLAQQEKAKAEQKAKKVKDEI